MDAGGAGGNSRFGSGKGLHKATTNNHNGQYKDHRFRNISANR